MRTRRLLLIAGASLLGFAAPANAVQVEVIADGLDNPRHLAFGGDSLYIAESGVGGDGPCATGPEGPVCFGTTGAVTLVDDDGGQSRIVKGLPSLAGEGSGDGAFGPHGVFVKRHRLLIANGGPTALNRDELAAEDPAADMLGRVLAIKKRGRITSLADVWGFERDNNPDEEVGNEEIDSNAVDVLVDRKRLVIADAGGNTLLKAKKHRRIKVLSLFPDREVPDPSGGTEPVEIQAVPTGVAEGPDGDYYMTQLTGFPFPVGAANVYRVDSRTGEAEVFASGFTNLMDLAFDEHGNLWVLEIDHDSLFGDNSDDGAIHSVDAEGNATQVELPAGTLTHPGGITVGEDGALYVTNHTDRADVGEVLRITLDDEDDEHDDDCDEEDDRHHDGHHHGRHRDRDK